MMININTHLNLNDFMVKTIQIITKYYNVDIKSGDIEKILDIMKNDEEFLNILNNMKTVEK